MVYLPLSVCLSFCAVFVSVFVCCCFRRCDCREEKKSGRTVVLAAQQKALVAQSLLPLRSDGRNLLRKFYPAQPLRPIPSYGDDAKHLCGCSCSSAAAAAQFDCLEAGAHDSRSTSQSRTLEGNGGGQQWTRAGGHVLVGTCNILNQHLSARKRRQVRVVIGAMRALTLARAQLANQRPELFDLSRFSSPEKLRSSLGFQLYS